MSEAPSDRPRSDLVGGRLGRYTIDGVIGRGGMSTLYRATDTRLGRRVALKVIAPALADDAEFRERFVSEARNTSAVDHANVVPLYDFDSADGHLYIALRHVDGTDLAGLTAGRPLAPARALALLAQVAAALDAVHARGLVHLDVKPANVLVTTRETAGGEHVYLADFGLTRDGEVGHRTADGDFLGSPTYAAPEHLRGDPVGPGSDIYSLTCVLFTCLTGHAPYVGSTAEVIDGHLTGRVPAIGDARIDEVVRRGLDPDPPRRHRTAGALVDAARDALAPSPGRPAPGPPPAPAVAPTPPVRLRDPLPPLGDGSFLRTTSPVPAVVGTLVIGLLVVAAVVFLLL